MTRFEREDVQTYFEEQYGTERQIQQSFENTEVENPGVQERTGQEGGDRGQETRAGSNQSHGSDSIIERSNHSGGLMQTEIQPSTFTSETLPDPLLPGSNIQ